MYINKKHHSQFSAKNLMTKKSSVVSSKNLILEKIMIPEPDIE